MLLGATYAGIGIDLAGTAVAHVIAHALAACGPISHGLATALGLEVSLPWCVEADDGRFDRAARVLGLDRASDLAPWFGSLLDRLEAERRLPPGFAGLEAATLAAEMAADGNRPMRMATLRPVTGTDLVCFAQALLERA